MADSVLRTKSKEFAKDIVFLCRKLKHNGVESALINQLLRCGTSVGANVHEAQYAQGTKDFISKFEIALKECNESEYWLELLFETNSISKTDFEDSQKKCIELRRMLVSTVTTLKANNSNKVFKRLGSLIPALLICVACAFSVVSLCTPRQKNKDLGYVACLEDAIKDDYEEYQILGYFDIYTEYAEVDTPVRIDSLFLVESNGRLDLHTPYKVNGEYVSLLSATDVKVNELSVYKTGFTPHRVEFVLTERKRDIPESTLCYYELDGYYFCVISISDI